MNKRASCGIYQIRNLANGKVYIGSSRDCPRRKGEHYTRLRRGAHINAKLQAAWVKHGEAAFEFSIICSVLVPDDLEAVEQEFLDRFGVVAAGYNLAPTAGNTAGWRANEETRRRMSEAAKRRDYTVQVAAMAAATKGKKRPQHVRDALLKSRLGAVASEETRRKQSESAKARGDNMPPEARARLIEIRRAKAKFTVEQQAQMAAMKAEGQTLKQIGAAFGITAESSVSLNIRRWRERHGERV